jgi:hypothetical protein
MMAGYSSVKILSGFAWTMLLLNNIYLNDATNLYVVMSIKMLRSLSLNLCNLHGCIIRDLLSHVFSYMNVSCRVILFVQIFVVHYFLQLSFALTMSFV